MLSHGYNNGIVLKDMIQYEIYNKKMYVGHSTTARLIVEQDIPRTENKQLMAGEYYYGRRKFINVL